MSYDEVLERIYKSLIKIVIRKVPIQYKISIKKDYYSYLKRKYVESDFIINGNIESLILRYVDYETFIVNSYDVNNFLSDIIYDSNLIEFERINYFIKQEAIKKNKNEKMYRNVIDDYDFVLNRFNYLYGILLPFNREIFKNEYINTLIDLQYIALNTKYKSLRIK